MSREVDVSIKQSVKQVVEKIEEFKDVINDNDLCKLLDSSFKVIECINKTANLLSIIKFKMFLKGLTYDKSSDEDLSRLMKYIESDDKAEFVGNIFKNIIISNSRIACCIMGLLVNDLIRKDRLIEQSDLKLIQALSILDDYDIKIFVDMCDYVDFTIERKLYKLSEKLIDKYIEEHNISKIDFSLVEKTLRRVGIVEGNIISEYLDIDDDIISYDSEEEYIPLYINFIGKEIYNYASKIISATGKNILKND